MRKDIYRPTKRLINEIIKELAENEQFDLEIPETLKFLGKFYSLNSKQQAYWLQKSTFLLSTLRNRLLITKKEQEILKKKTIAFLGLSVGSHAVNSWMMESRADCIKISDPDFISPSNLNRLSSGWDKVGNSKVEVTKDKVIKMAPFCSVISYKSADITIIENIILGAPKVDLIVEQIDSLEGKIKARKIAKKAGIPVLMATDVGDNVFLDVERYDIDGENKLFNGRVEEIENLEISKLSNIERIRLSVKIVGLEHNSERMLSSLLSIGREIKTWPQLGSTSVIAGGLIAKTARKIFLGEKVTGGRYYFDFDEILESDFLLKSRIEKRNKLLSQLK